MIFVAPVQGIVKAPVEVRKNMWRTLVVRMREDGVVPVTATEASLQ